MIDRRNFFDQTVKNELRTYDKIWKNANGHSDDYTTGCLLYYPYFKEYHKLITIALNKQQTLAADPKAEQQIILMEIYIDLEIQTCFSLLKKWGKQF